MELFMRKKFKSSGNIIIKQQNELSKIKENIKEKIKKEHFTRNYVFPNYFQTNPNIKKKSESLIELRNPFPSHTLKNRINTYNINNILINNKAPIKLQQIDLVENSDFKKKKLETIKQGLPNISKIFDISSSELPQQINKYYFNSKQLFEKFKKKRYEFIDRNRITCPDKFYMFNKFHISKEIRSKILSCRIK